jgi:hypothetical protein
MEESEGKLKGAKLQSFCGRHSFRLAYGLITQEGHQYNDNYVI